MRRLIVLVGGEIGVFFFGYWAGAIFGVALCLSGIAGSALALGAALAWPRYRIVTYLGLGPVALLALVTGAYAALVIAACVNGDCI